MRRHFVVSWVERSPLVTIPPLVTRTKRTVDVLRERQGNERAVVASCAEPPRGVWDIEQQRASKKNTLAEALVRWTVVMVDVSLPLEIEAGKTCRYMESPDGVFSWYLKMATACGLHVVHEYVYAAYSELLAHAWVCVTKLWKVCQRPQSRPWRMRLATSCA